MVNDMAKEHVTMLTETNMLVSLQITNSTVLASKHGLTERNTTAAGKTKSSMGLATKQKLMEPREMENGKKENMLSGLVKLESREMRVLILNLTERIDSTPLH